MLRYKKSTTFFFSTTDCQITKKFLCSFLKYMIWFWYSGFFLWLVAEIKFFFFFSFQNCTIFCNWLCKYVTASLKIEKNSCFFHGCFSRLFICLHQPHKYSVISLKKKTAKFARFLGWSSKKVFFFFSANFFFCNLIL